MWIKKGKIYNVTGNLSWAKTHAQVPVVDVLFDRLRIYYSTRNEQGKSNVSYIEVDKLNPNKILYVHEKTLFELGKLGTFDDSGIMPSSIVNVGRQKYMYYIGWTTRGTIPYQNAIGLAVSSDEGRTFEKMFEGPIITINHIEPHFSGTSFVLLEAGIFKMWYLSCVSWEVFNGKPEPLYNIKYAESNDGVNWRQTGKVAVDLDKDEGGLVSASVIRDKIGYKMWYGKRKKEDYRQNSNNSYRIGYAESQDGVHWERKDMYSGIDISDSGWDSEMISYPNVVSYNGKLLMFYNGNNFGKTGFGYALKGNNI